MQVHFTTKKTYKIEHETDRIKLTWKYFMHCLNVIQMEISSVCGCQSIRRNFRITHEVLGTCLAKTSLSHWTSAILLVLLLLLLFLLYESYNKARTETIFSECKWKRDIFKRYKIYVYRCICIRLSFQMFHVLLNLQDTMYSFYFHFTL